MNNIGLSKKQIDLIIKIAFNYGAQSSLKNISFQEVRSYIYSKIISE